MNQKAEEIDSKEDAIKKELWEIEDKVNEIETEELNVIL